MLCAPSVAGVALEARDGLAFVMDSKTGLAMLEEEPRLNMFGNLNGFSLRLVERRSAILKRAAQLLILDIERPIMLSEIQLC